MNTSPYSQIGDNLNGDFTYAKNLYHAAKRALGLKHKAARAAEPWQFQLETAAERLSAMLEYESGNFCDWFHDAPEMLMEKYPEHVTVFSKFAAAMRALLAVLEKMRAARERARALARQVDSLSASRRVSEAHMPAVRISASRARE
mmetsp:Transcript_52406/g.139248  ORF Transcript_52406/g.139248 Transcript_52406/m.139248 type:complete len:146 (+) Transcript_52406:288-725(+)